MEGGAWWATIHGVAKSRTGLSDFTLFVSTDSIKDIMIQVSNKCEGLPGPEIID